MPGASATRPCLLAEELDDLRNGRTDDIAVRTAGNFVVLMLAPSISFNSADLSALSVAARFATRWRSWSWVN